MKKKVIRLSSNLESALERGVEPYWYAVCHAHTESLQLLPKNPWNQDLAELEQIVYLADDCVITIRPARHSLSEDGSGNYEKDHYFLEISNQDASMTFSSAKTYSWDNVNQLAFFFKGLSFSSANRVWKAKKP